MKLNTWGGLTDDEQKFFAIMRYGELLCGRVAVRREAIIVEDIANNHVEGSEAVRAAGYGAYAGFPLLAGERLLGTIAFITREKTHFDEGEVQIIQAICNQVATMLNRAQLMQELMESEERLRFTQEAADLGSWDIELPTGKVVWNRRHALMQGYDTHKGPAFNSALAGKGASRTISTACCKTWSAPGRSVALLLRNTASIAPIPKSCAGCF